MVGFELGTAHLYTETRLWLTPDGEYRIQTCSSLSLAYSYWVLVSAHSLGRFLQEEVLSMTPTVISGHLFQHKKSWSCWVSVHLT